MRYLLAHRSTAAIRVLQQTWVFLFVAVIPLVSGAVGHAQTRPAGHNLRDLEGVWDFSMLTPLQRPSDYRDKRDLPPDEAVVFERILGQANKDRVEQNTRAGNLGRGVDDEIWAEPGSLASINGRFPTSLIVEPSDGRMPALTSEAQRRIAERRVVAARLDAARVSEKGAMTGAAIMGGSGGSSVVL